MATIGELKWASLIKGSKVEFLPTTESRRTWYLSFAFGKFTRYYSREVDISQSLLNKYAWIVPSKLGGSVHLNLVYRKKGSRLAERVSLPLVWPYIVRSISGRHDGSGPFEYTFPKRSYLQIRKLSATDGKYAKVKAFFIGLPYSKSYLLSGSSFSSPQSFMNLMFINSVFPSKFISKASALTKKSGPYQRKNSTPRASPEIRTITYKDALETVSTPYTETNRTVEAFRRSWTGSTTPGFATKKRRQLPVNPHTVDLVRTNWSHGYDLRNTYASPSTTYNNGWGVTLFPFLRAPMQIAGNPFFALVENAALKKLNNNAFTSVQANLAQTLGEYKQLSRMVKTTAARITGAVLALKKGQIGNAIERLLDGKPPPRMKAGNPSRSKSVASNWLELQYGWKPLLSDVDGSMRALANYMSQSTDSRWVTGSAVLPRVDTLPIKEPASAPNGKKIGDEITTDFYQCRFGIQYRIKDEQTALLSQLGFTSPINLAWELLPWSFVVDWFIPVGDYLKAFSGGEGLEFVSGYKTLFGRRNLRLYAIYDGPITIAPTSQIRCYANRDQESVALSRSKLNAWPTPQLPAFRNPFASLNWEDKALNALALMRTAFRK